jgi:hypothetical protein
MPAAACTTRASSTRSAAFRAHVCHGVLAMLHVAAAAAAIAMAVAVAAAAHGASAFPCAEAHAYTRTRAFAFRPSSAAGRSRSSSLLGAHVRAPAPAPAPAPAHARSMVRLAAQAEGKTGGEAAPPSTKTIDSIIRDLHGSSLAFRVVVIGNGAILEATSTLGPHMAESTSPKTGERLVTFASDDRSFEFHLKPDTVATVCFAESRKPGTDKTLRIVRMLREDSSPICSLILADGSADAISWYETMTTRYGHEVTFGEEQ